jgi:hypothetical protein
VAAVRCALPLAKTLRQGLIEVAKVKIAAQGQEGKMERMYGYLTGNQFHKRVASILEAYVSMHTDLDAEKRAINKHWGRRQRQLDLLLSGAAGMYGDLQGIVEKALPEINGLELPGLEEENATESLNFSDLDESIDQTITARK